MSWLSTLYETYRNMAESGLYEDLLPIAHTTQVAHIQVTVNEVSEFVGARVLLKEEGETVIPCTEQSAGRAGSHPVNHPLMDKLQYVAGDYTRFGGEKGDSFHAEYMTALEEWCQSQYSNPKVRILYEYLKKGTLIANLIDNKVLYCDEQGKLLKKYPDKANEPEIFKVIQGMQSDAFVRFEVSGVEVGNGCKTGMWEDLELQKDYIDYYLSRRKKEGKALCYVLGEEASLSVNHPSKLRNTGDMAKLISANDTTGFTFRGRFLDSGEAAGVSYEVSQGAHNALKWLVKKQGKNYGGRVFIVWNPKGYDVPEIDEDSLDAMLGRCEEIPDTAEVFAEMFHKAMAGYYKTPGQYHGKIAILGIDAATTGRMAVTFYREILQNELMENLEHWHGTCAWKHRYRFLEGKVPVEFYGAPSPKDIALAAFGVERTNYLETDDKLLKNTVERIFHCIIDGEKLPRDIAEGAYRNVCHPQNYKNYYTWYKVLTINCALLKKYYYDKDKEEWNVELNNKEESLPYLCGRLLAVADVLERNTYSDEDRKHRTTNAMRYFTKFMEHPCQTWEKLNKQLLPYISKLGGKAVFYQRLMGEISQKVNEYNFYDARNLDGRMALGFYSQQNDLYMKKESKADSVAMSGGDNDGNGAGEIPQ